MSKDRHVFAEKECGIITVVLFTSYDAMRKRLKRGWRKEVEDTKKHLALNLNRYSERGSDPGLHPEKWSTVIVLPAHNHLRQVAAQWGDRSDKVEERFLLGDLAGYPGIRGFRAAAIFGRVGGQHHGGFSNVIVMPQPPIAKEVVRDLAYLMGKDMPSDASLKTGCAVVICTHHGTFEVVKRK